jgi:large subunit ribosomal protein L6
VQGPKGVLDLKLSEKLNIKHENGEITINPKNAEDKESRALWGTYQRLISNMVTGVTDGFTKVLEFNGVGWRMEVKGKILVMHLGYSHPIEYHFPDQVDINLEKNVITVTGIDKQQVGQIASEIRSKRKPEPYKGKGIKYKDEVIRRKAGKQAKSAA